MPQLRLSELGIGDAVKQDCLVEDVDSGYEVLGCLKGQVVNVDELDYLAKRLDSFDVYEMAQYQAACAAFVCKDIRALINMTFCCQETTVISDFSKLDEAGKKHYLTRATSMPNGSLTTAMSLEALSQHSV